MISNPINFQDFALYSNIFIDCDGVILDSNHIKEANISRVLTNYLPNDLLTECLRYFNDNPGVPREEKLIKYIESEYLRAKILDDYNKLNLKSLKNAKLVDGILDFLKAMRLAGKKIFMVSGGSEDELFSIFSHKNLLHYFDAILGGPKTKSENIKLLNYKGNSIFIGDSQLDLEIAILFNMDFVFVSGYTKFDLNNIQQKIKFKTIRNLTQIKLN
jgi:phosphoglycolate phosphatase-like HAD superfamily hydrolase